MDLSRKSLPDMNKGELKEILKTLDIDYEDSDTNAVMVQRIQESGKYKAQNESGVSGVKGDGKGNRVHPLLGKYRRVIVHPVGATNQNTSIFASIGIYTVEFQPREVVDLPTDGIRLLKAPTIPEHYYDPNVISENGNKGAHMTRYVPKYIVELAED